MIRHVVLFRFADDAPASAATELSGALDRLAASLDCVDVERYRHGPDAGLRDGNWDYAVTGDFPDAETFSTYATHPDHIEMIERYVNPVVAERRALQFEF